MQWLLLALFACAPGTPAAEAAPTGVEGSTLRLLDDGGALSDPLAAAGDVRVFVFVRRDCPIANRYAPELERLRQAHAQGDTARRVSIFLVYVDPGDTAALIDRHQREHGMTIRWFVDGEHALARLAGATITPEAAVYSPARDGRRELLYRGRIDDRFIDVGRTRPAATVHELGDAIDAALRGTRPAPPGGPAIGCFIEDAR